MLLFILQISGGGGVSEMSAYKAMYSTFYSLFLSPTHYIMLFYNNISLFLKMF